MKCIHCGKTVADEARFCKYCGTRLRRTCAACGAVLDEDARFCAACGAEALAELDFSKTLADLSAADCVAPAGIRHSNVGFYFSRRISRQNRSTAENCFSAFGDKLAFVEDQTLNRLAPGPNALLPGQAFVRRRTDISRDIGIKAIALYADGSILAAGFDWGTGGEPIITLWRYDAALNMREATEVLRMTTSAERRTVKMRLTDQNLFVFIWDNHAEGKREIIKYGLASGKLEQKQLDGKRVDLWYIDGERIYFRGEREDETFFGVLDTAPETWTVRRVWTIGDGPDEIPDAPVYCDFDKGIAWTAATANERHALGVVENVCVARELAPGHKLCKDSPVWQTPEAGAVNLFLDYFDGERCYKANNVLAMDACDREGSKHRWKNTLHGDTENVLVWGDWLLADFTSHGYRAYPAQTESPEDIYRDGILIREL